jgi:release factor glutamine methyltransferase
MSSSGQDTEPWTVARLLNWTREHFARQELDSPRLCAEILLAHAMGCARIHLYTRFDEVPDEAVRERFRTLVRGAGGGTPIAYLTGSKEFFSLAFEVTPAVLIPRPETEILVERTIALARKAPDAVRRVLDLGTGSGCIAISLARNLPDMQVCASDVSADALAVAQRNAARHDVAERITFREGDLFAPWAGDGAGAAAQFDVIVCNPPYVATDGAPLDDNVRDHEPHAALLAGADGLDVIRRLIAGAPEFLATGGHLLMEMAFDQARAVRALVDDPVWQDATMYRDGGGHERVLHVRRSAATQSQVA